MGWDEDYGIDFNFGHNLPDPEAAREDVPTYDHSKTCGGTVECRVCGMFFGYHEHIGDTMIPRGNAAPSGGGGQGQRQNRKPAGLPPFGPELIPANETVDAKILAARTEADGFRPGQQLVAVKILFRTNTYLWRLRPGNPNLEKLGNELGDDETGWAGADVQFSKYTDDFDGKVFLECHVPEKTETPAKTSKKR